jgi:hypothetical protein
MLKADYISVFDSLFVIMLIKQRIRFSFCLLLIKLFVNVSEFSLLLPSFCLSCASPLHSHTRLQSLTIIIVVCKNILNTKGGG